MTKSCFDDLIVRSSRQDSFNRISNFNMCPFKLFRVVGELMYKTVPEMSCNWYVVMSNDYYTYET